MFEMKFVLFRKKHFVMNLSKCHIHFFKWIIFSHVSLHSSIFSVKRSVSKNDWLRSISIFYLILVFNEYLIILIIE